MQLLVYYQCQEPRLKSKFLEEGQRTTPRGNQIATCGPELKHNRSLSHRALTSILWLCLVLKPSCDTIYTKVHDSRHQVWQNSPETKPKLSGATPNPA
ncbi:hypothetical protein A0H81_06314 [Grifola frondosa]|uniref:Uncharacterized protein n=1 Tax=Grifola frondosa TaxID=5627 RepID=A0A1C7MCA6_GRIFR|nr:hypothetical protein A0H81_06314 [Grifola frondosa]